MVYEDENEQGRHIERIEEKSRKKPHSAKTNKRATLPQRNSPGPVSGE